MKKNKHQGQQVIELNQLPLNEKLSFKDNSQKQLMATHIIQKIDDFFGFFDEVYRVLKDGGIIQISAPYYTSVRATQDPTHKRSISEATFVYLSKKWREVNKIPYKMICNFEVVSINHAISQEYQGRSQDAVQFALQHYWNVASDIIVILKKI